MRIVDRQTFLRLPAGTVFSTYEPCVFGPLMIKGETIRDVDFWSQQIADAIDHNDSEEFVTLLDKATVDAAVDLEMDFDNPSRDGLYEDSQLYAVWSRYDVSLLIRRLHVALVDSGESYSRA